MKRSLAILLLLSGLLQGCLPKFEDEPELPADPRGSLEFRFILPVYQIPRDGIHRISLGFAYSADSLYRGLFFKKVNVSDFQEVYSLKFMPEDYYFDAVITCSCGGDTCLNGGFPGGRFGMKHLADKFTIETGHNTVIETHFQ
jgi:hypothetical protein